jgi:hypothetical protein
MKNRQYSSIKKIVKIISNKRKETKIGPDRRCHLAK